MPRSWTATDGVTTDEIVTDSENKVGSWFCRQAAEHHKNSASLAYNFSD